jgi:hypothetical protein
MSDYTYQMHDTEAGTYILIFVDASGGQAFHRRVFVPISEYHPSALACAVDGAFRELYTGSHEFVVKWLREHPGRAKMVGVGGDFQILSVSEYLSHYA